MTSAYEIAYICTYWHTHTYVYALTLMMIISYSLLIFPSANNLIYWYNYCLETTEMLMCLAFPFIDISTKLIDNELCHSTERLQKKKKTNNNTRSTLKERGSTPRYRCRRWRCLSVCSHCFHVCECYSVATHNDSHTQNLVQLAFSFLPVRRVHLQVSGASSSSNSKPG